MSYRLELNRPGVETREVTDIHSDSISFVREHSALSDFELTVAYDTSLESERFAECHLYFDSEHLFAGRVLRISSNEREAKTTVSGFGAPGYDLKLGSATVTYTDEFAWRALQDYLDNHSNIGGTVTNPEGQASSVDDHDLQDADTTAEWNAITTLADTDPFAVQNGNVELLQTLYFSEGEDTSTSSGTGFVERERYSGDGPTDGFGEAERMDASGEWVEYDFDIGYTIPEADVGLAVRWDNDDGGSGYQVSFYIDGNKTDESQADVAPSWKDHEDGQHSGGSFTYDGGDLTAGTHTVRIEADGVSNWHDIDCVALYDKGSRFGGFTYNFDNTLSDGTDGGRYLDGPELRPPGGVRVAFDLANTVFRITAVSITASLDDTTGSQALGWSVDGGSTWNDTANTSSISDDSVSTPTLSVEWSAVLASYGSRSNTTPLSGFNGQVIQSGDLDIDGDTVGVFEDQTIQGNHLENIQRLAKRAGVRFYLNHDPDEANWSVEAFAEGDRTGSADWATLERSRKVNVKGYANHLIGKGALQPDGSRLRFELKDDAEIAAFGKQITRTFVEPSIDDLRDLESEVRTRLDNAIDEDKVMGTIDIMPEALAPGLTYTVSAWSADVSLERLTYRISGGEARGTLEFAKPEGLGEKVSEVAERTRGVGDAV